VLFDTPPLLHRTAQHLLPLLLLLLSAQIATAAEAEQETRWYDVEVIIFSQTSQQFRDSELWPMDVSLPDMENARSLLPAAGSGATANQPVAFSLLGDDELTMDGEAARINAAPELELLLHLGWRQPGLPQEQAVSIQIHDGMLEDGSINASGKTVAPAESYRMEGTLKLVLSRYLHIYADLLYREPLPESFSSDMFNTNPTAESAPLQTTAAMAEKATEPDLFALAANPFNSDMMPRYRIYRMQQSRRMRSGELHYLDHPVLGMVIRVTPHELPKAESATGDASAASS
jgi:hypothetical protein